MRKVTDLKKIRKACALIFIIVLGAWGLGYSQDTRDEAQQHYLKGNRYYEQARYEEAQEEFQKALDILLTHRGESLKKAPAKPEPAPRQEEPPPMQKTRIASRESQEGLEYIIGADDVLQISVWQNPDLTQEAIVRPDGRISFPLIGDIQAAGQTVPELDTDVTERLKEYIKYPEVSISIKKIGGQKVIVLGEINSPGVYSVSGAKTILEAIALAGGFTRDAVASSVILVRGGFANPKPQRMNLTKALNGDLRLNVVLQSEDIVFVPKKFIADLNYFLNQILEPLSKGAMASAAASGKW